MRRITRVLLTIAALSAPVSAYVTSRILSDQNVIVQERWNSAAFPIPWRMNPIKGATINGNRAQEDVFRSAFQQWQGIATASITFAEGAPTTESVLPGYDQINLITTNLTSAQYGQYGTQALGLTLVSAFDSGGPGIVDQHGRPIEFPGQIVEADILFNPTEPFTTNTTTVEDRFDLESIAVHEIGHLLGLDHTAIVGSSMFPTIGEGHNYAKTLSPDDIAGVSTIYPNSAFTVKGAISGTVRTTSNVPVYGAIVVAVNVNGIPVASAITDPSGQYTIAGLDAGSYTVFAEPMDRPLEIYNLSTLINIYPGQTILTNFTTRYR